MATQSLRRRTIDSAIWTLLGYGASQILRFGSNLILASILEPQFFGLMAIINILLVGIALFSDVGIAQSIINNPRGEDRDFLDTAWTTQVIRGFILWGFCLLITIPAAQFYQDDRLLTFIPIAGLTSIIEGFQTTRVFVAQRRLEQRQYSLFELTSLIMGVTTMVSLAFLLHNIWALILAGLFQASFITIAGYFFFPGPRHRFCWDTEAVKSLVSLGRWIVFASATMFIAEQADRLILAKLVDWKTIGVYSIAYNLSNVPKELIKTLSYRVIYPAVAQQAELSRRDLQRKIEQQRRILLAGCAVILAILVTTGDLVISVLYNEKYANAIWMMPILCGGIWVSVLFNSMNNVLVAINKPLYSAYSYAARLVIVSGSLMLGFRVGGLPGAILAISVSDLPTYLVNVYGLRQEKLSCIRQDLIFTVFFVLILAFCLGARYWLGFGHPLQRLIIP